MQWAVEERERERDEAPPEKDLPVSLSLRCLAMQRYFSRTRGDVSKWIGIMGI